MRIAVTGAPGQLGTAIVEEFLAAHDVTAFTRADFDITDDLAVRAAMEAARPDVIINCAAFNNVDLAEDRPVEALNANAFAVRALARAAETTGARLVHYSSDFVFDGTASAPYREADPPNPRSTYAASKLLGEWFALEAPGAYVLRVESLFGSASAGPPGAGSKGTVAAIVNAIMSGGEVRVFEDRTVSPTYVTDAARATIQIVERRIEPGLYHCVNAGCCTWLEFAQELASQLGIEARLLAARMADVPMRAERPLYCALATDKLASAGVIMPSWQDAVRRYLERVLTSAPQQSHPPGRQSLNTPSGPATRCRPPARSAD